MVLERLYVIPHGDEILDHPNGNSKRMYSAISQMVSGDSSELIALISPHSLILPERVAIVNTENAEGIYHIIFQEPSIADIRNKYEKLTGEIRLDSRGEVQNQDQIQQLSLKNL